MAKETKKQTDLINLDDFKIEQLPELNGKKAEIESELAKFPAVKIIDNETYESAKKSRTGVKTIRTGLEKEKDDVVKKIKTIFLGTVITAYDEIKDEVSVVEKERQDEVTRWEDIKKKEKEEKDRIEQERVDGIKKIINEFVNTWESAFSLIKFEDIEGCKNNFEKAFNLVDSGKSSFKEFSLLFDKKVADLRTFLDSRIQTLTEQENLRLERVRLDEEKTDRERIDNIKKSISDWFNGWIISINNMNAENLFELNKKFSKEQPLDCQELQEDFQNKGAELRLLFTSRVSVIKESEKQRVLQDKFLKDKAEFELKQTQAKIKERESKLIKLGFSEKENNDYFFNGFVFLLDDIIASTDENFETIFNEAKNYISKYNKMESFISETISDEIKSPVISFGDQSETVFKNIVDKSEKETVNNINESNNIFDIDKINSQIEFNDNHIVIPKQLIIDTPNDQELGSLVRKMLSNE